MNAPDNWWQTYHHSRDNNKVYALPKQQTTLIGSWLKFKLLFRHFWPDAAFQQDLFWSKKEVFDSFIHTWSWVRFTGGVHFIPSSVPKNAQPFCNTENWEKFDCIYFFLVFLMIWTHYDIRKSPESVFMWPKIALLLAIYSYSSQQIFCKVWFSWISRELPVSGKIWIKFQDCPGPQGGSRTIYHCTGPSQRIH